MSIVWSATALDQLDDIYSVITGECGAPVAGKWFLKICDAVDRLADFPLAGPEIPECAFADHFTSLKHLRQLVVAPYRVIYEVAGKSCNILGVMRESRLISGLGEA